MQTKCDNEKPKAAETKHDFILFKTVRAMPETAVCTHEKFDNLNPSNPQTYIIMH